MSNQVKGLLAAALSLVCSGVAYGVTPAVQTSYSPDLDKYIFARKISGKFNHDLWMSGTSRRIVMLGDLLLTYHLIGMNRSEVHQMLGEQDPNDRIAQLGTEANMESIDLERSEMPREGGNAGFARYIDFDYSNEGFVKRLRYKLVRCENDQPFEVLVSRWLERNGGLVSDRQIRLNTVTAQSDKGIVGVVIDSKTGVVQRVLPGSDLVNFGIEPGDAVLRYNSHRFQPGTNFADESLGPTGQAIEMVFRHHDHEIRCKVKRVSASAFLPFVHDSYLGYNRIEGTAFPIIYRGCGFGRFD
jgi:hypothetical protein